MSKKAQEQIELVKTITQSVISVLIVGGGGAAILFKPDSASIIAPIISLVVSYYFLSANQNRTIKKTVSELTGIEDSSSAMQVARAASSGRTGR